MSAKFTNARQLATPTNTVIWNNVPQASASFFYRYDPAGGTSAAVLNTQYFITRGLGSFYDFTNAVGAGGGDTLNVRFVVANASAQVSHLHNFNRGTSYHIAVTYDQGVQTCWINGIPYAMGTLTGNTRSGSWPLAFGVASLANPPFIFTLSDFAAWNGYALTAADVAALRDGTLLPPAIGAGATWRGRWTLAGTTDATVQVGDPGVANAYGDHAYDLTAFQGGGSAVYAPALAFEPSVDATPYVATSGKSIGVMFSAASNGSPVLPTQVLAIPTVKVNGVDEGPLIVPWCTGYHMRSLFSLPAGLAVGPSDVVTLSAPAGWANTAIGIAGALDGTATIPNRCGQSSAGPWDLVASFKPGWNNAHLGSAYWSTWTGPKNWISRCDNMNPGTQDANGQPLTAKPGFTSVSSDFYKCGPSTTIDRTLVVPVGYWCTCWDDTDPTHTPTILDIFTNSSHILTVTEMTDGYNPGSGGVGVCHVYRVDALSTLPIGSGPDAAADLRLRISNATGTFHFANAVVYGPGDFTYTPGVPTVVDRTDMHAPSNAYLERLSGGCGSLRWADSLFGFAGISQESEPEHLYKLTDFAWGLWSGKVDKSPFWTTARPWDPGVTPYFYTTLFGSPFDATLGTSIDAITTTLNVTDAATAPVIVGLRLKAGTELMRVMDVSGTAVTVERGSCGTTAAPHSAGTIQVQNRWLATGTAIPKGEFFELVGATPHGINTGQTLKAYGTWPVFTFTNGVQPFGGSPLNTAPNTLLMTTGPNTVVGMLPGNESPWVTLKQSYSLPANCRFAAAWPDTPAIPVEFAAKATAHFDGCNLHINIPHSASDSLIYQIAIWVRDNFPSARRVYVEFSNEPWNYYFDNFNMLKNFSLWLYPNSTNGWEFYVLRATQAKTIFRNVFGDRSGEIFLMINTNKGDAAGVAAKLEFAKGLGVPIDVVALATYTGFDRATATQEVFWQVDDDQAVDMYCIDLLHNTKQYPSIFAALNGVVAAYNAKYGESVQLYGYEGGPGCAAPVLSTTLTGAVDASATSIPVALTDGFIAGTPVLVGSEWMTIAAPPAGGKIPVARGQYGTAAASHASGASIRTAYLERSHDILYNPNWYFAEQDMYGFVQRNNFAQLNQYALCMGAADANSYFGAYHTPWQIAGRGDGSDGKADNRLTLACPGKAHTKAADVDQDVVNVSVRGRAYIDWMDAVAGVGPPPKRHMFPFYRRGAY